MSWRIYINSCMNHSHRLLFAAQGLSSGGRHWVAAGFNRWKLISLVCVLLFAPGQAPVHSQVATADLYTSEHEQNPQVDQFYTQKFREAAREQQEQFRQRIAIPDALGDDVPTLAAVEAAKELKNTRSAAGPPFWLQGFLVFIVIVLSGILLLFRIFPETIAQIKDQFAPWQAMRAGVVADSIDIRVEAQAFAEFVSNFRTGPALRPDTEPKLPPFEEFLAGWPRILADLRKQLREASSTPDTRIRRRYLRDLGRELRSVKGQTGMPEMLPVWQMVCALEGLIRQLADKINEVTPSTLRTVGGGLDLLAELCQPGLDAQLLTRRPVRLLAVDDDPISRHAISFALKRALHTPDLAAGGEAGLALAREQAYDVIFLDVEMPDIDGFELCTQIHKTASNRATPVVFVTGQNDFEARVQSTLSGGCDLIAKPFLTFELAVKALTLTMRNRMQEGRGETHAHSAQPLPDLAVNVAISQEAVRGGSSAAEGDDGVRPVQPIAENVPAQIISAEEFVPAPTLDSEEIATEFLTRAPEHLSWVNEMLQSALKVTDETAWLPMLSDVYLRLNSFTPDEKFAKGHPAMQLSSALEKLLRKLLQGTTPPTKATMLTVTSAVELLRDLCATVTPGVASVAPVHLLVVDDDPVARRALTGALQTTFEKPVCAENGGAALALAAERTFDVIFLDVQMPGMDGFEVFARLRSEGCNTATPVVFVCGRTDLGNVTEISACGDCDIVAKPFLTGELLVKTLTLMLRRQREASAPVS